jgi:hypothetical protein
MRKACYLLFPGTFQFVTLGNLFYQPNSNSLFLTPLSTSGDSLMCSQPGLGSCVSGLLHPLTLNTHTHSRVYLSTVVNTAEFDKIASPIFSCFEGF